MPEKLTFKNVLDDVSAAHDWLAREIERLEATGKKNIKVHYPKLHAQQLRISELDDTARYGKHEAIGHRGGPYEITIEYDG
jgi:hypothetical protein